MKFFLIFQISIFFTLTSCKTRQDPPSSATKDIEIQSDIWTECSVAASCVVGSNTTNVDLKFADPRVDRDGCVAFFRKKVQANTSGCDSMDFNASDVKVARLPRQNVELTCESGFGASLCDASNKLIKMLSALLTPGDNSGFSDDSKAAAYRSVVDPNRVNYLGAFAPEDGGKGYRVGKDVAKLSSDLMTYACLAFDATHDGDLHKFDPWPELLTTTYEFAWLAVHMAVADSNFPSVPDFCYARSYKCDSKCAAGFTDNSCSRLHPGELAPYNSGLCVAPDHGSTCFMTQAPCPPQNN